MAAPVLFIPHGGGPLPLLGEPGHAALVAFLRQVPEHFATPKAVLVISAHWEAAEPTVLGTPSPALYYDYYNFPEAAYSIHYPLQPDHEVTDQLAALLAEAGFDVCRETQRGFDHGVFVPLKLMYPDANIPCAQLSLLEDMDPARHIALGRALHALRQQGVLILGSGSSYHNMQRPRPGIDPGEDDIQQFDQWLRETCSEASLTLAQRHCRLLDWLRAPHARFCHPREEHLLPLHVCFGAAMAAASEQGDDQLACAQCVFDAPMMGRTMLGFLWR